MGHIEDYARRTAEKVWAAPEVQQHWQEQAQEAKRDRDDDMSADFLAPTA